MQKLLTFSPKKLFVRTVCLKCTVLFTNNVVCFGQKDCGFYVADAESTDGWSDFFFLNRESGTITAVKDLKELADTIVQLRTQVID